MTSMSRRGLLTGGAAASAGLIAGGAGLMASGSPAASADPGSQDVRPWRRFATGFDVLAASGYEAVKGRKVGLMSNPTGVTKDQRHIVDVMHASDKIDLVAVFGPEHGFRGSAQAGGSEGDKEDPRTKLPVYDTYTKPVEKFAEFFKKAGIEVLLFDIQDVSARFYTYIWTLYSCMRAGVLTGTKIVVLDRPNPLGGAQATGPILHKEFASGIGLEPIAQQHGMTMGELGRYYNGEFLKDKPANLAVVKMKGWRRGTQYEETGLPWVPPSPNMPTVDTAYLYNGTGMFEGTNMSEGRGTTRPFEIIGAPYADWHWVDELTKLKLPGVVFREAYFVPTFSKHQGKNCAGVQVVVTDRRACDPIKTGLAMIATAKKLYPNDYAWRETQAPFFIDKLTGSDAVRKGIDAGKSVDEIAGGWASELAQFRAKRARYLLYR